MHTEELAKGAAFAQERAEREARLQRPLFVMPTSGIFTSGFGYRWGVLHGGIDIANSIGTPILAAADGVVIDAGPTAGYGAWVKLRHADGTVTLYGHVNTWLVEHRPARDGRRPDRHHRQPRQLHRAAPALRGAAERHRPRRPRRVAGQAGTQRPAITPADVASDDGHRSDDPASSGATRPGRDPALRRTTSIIRATDRRPTRRRRARTTELYPARQARRGDAPTRRPDPKRLSATAVVSILSGWATAVIATDLITGWWRTDRLFCVAVGFLTAVSAAATIGGLIALLLRRRMGRLLIVVGLDRRAADLRRPVRRGRQAAAGGVRHPGAAAGQYRARAVAGHPALGTRRLELLHRRVVVHELDPARAAEVDERHRGFADAGDLLDAAQPVLVVSDPVSRLEHQ